MDKAAAEEKKAAAASFAIKEDFALTDYEQRARGEILKSVDYLDAEGLNLVKRAMDCAIQAHRGSLRLSGEPYISHVFEVVKILTAYKLDAYTLATGFLHDVLEEKTPVTSEFIRMTFGKELSSLVDDVTRLTGLFSRQEHEVRRFSENVHIGRAASTENLRRIFLAMVRDLRVILVKFADRLHNLRTLEYCEPSVQKTIALESLDIFAPIASRLGIWEFKAEIENLAFRYAYPEEFARLNRDLDQVRPMFVKVLEKVVTAVRGRLDSMHINNKVEYRFKNLYSIYRKMARTGKRLSEVYDLAALRIIVPTVEDCYMIFGVIHSLWSPMNGRIKDYIARPKSNNYRCLHTTVFGPDDVPLEIQIRTFDMHKVNEIGVAAHWAYKEGKSAAGQKNKSIFAQLYPWIRGLFDAQGDSGDSDVSEHVKVELMKREVFVFTPQGDVIDLPAGSTPIDFAYRIHTDVGSKCVGATVNGRMVPLTYKLVNADVVSIQTSKNGKPSRDWLRVCASHQALSKIRAWFKKECREENLQRGREALKAELKRLHAEELFNNEEAMLKAANQLSFVTVDDMLAGIGYGEYSAVQIAGRLQGLAAKPQAAPRVSELFPSSEPEPAAPAVRKSKPGREIAVEGMDTILTKLAHCCTPVPGDSIIGYITIGSGVSVHRSDCSNLLNLKAKNPGRIVNCSWNKQESSEGRYTVQAAVEAWDRSGLMADLLSCLGDLRIKVKSCQGFSSGNRAQVKITIEVTGSEEMETALKALRGVRSVIFARRVKSK
ncbi:bifunctional (p)ppGpp synthetase/guanosine-3',5'-bis(diphosphate) 3'-pyrophosphohydrolase [bacterium]|nr:bifunctional (p)ppGpp synthetase/guanosine-3',5'-bis(diphosphate) 3'-pyrophosphohydrolase [bacterium]